jgi:hypothetical protein
MVRRVQAALGQAVAEKPPQARDLGGGQGQDLRARPFHALGLDREQRQRRHAGQVGLFHHQMQATRPQVAPGCDVAQDGGGPMAQQVERAVGLGRVERARRAAQKPHLDQPDHEEHRQRRLRDGDGAVAPDEGRNDEGRQRGKVAQRLDFHDHTRPEAQARPPAGPERRAPEEATWHHGGFHRGGIPDGFRRDHEHASQVARSRPGGEGRRSGAGRRRLFRPGDAAD